MSEQLVQLASFATVAEASMILNHLEEAGVRVFLSSEMAAGFMAGVRIHIAESEIKRALDILIWLRQQASLPDDWEESAEQDAEVWQCDRCGESVEVEQATCPYCGQARQPGETA